MRDRQAALEAKRQALLEAGWQENRTAWEGTEEPAFSPQYLRWRTRLLADPFGWGKKQLRPLWAKALRTAACILLAASVTLGSLMAVSPTVAELAAGDQRKPDDLYLQPACQDQHPALQLAHHLAAGGLDTPAHVYRHMEILWAARKEPFDLCLLHARGQ